MVEYQPLHPAEPYENILSALSRKISNGSELTIPERLMASSATAQVIHADYGPTPAQMELARPDLPETVKGVLAQYSA